MSHHEYGKMHGESEEMGGKGLAGGCLSHHGQGLGHGGMGFPGQVCPGLWAFMTMRKWSRMMPGMEMMGMGQGMMGGMAPWRRFMSSDEKVARLEEYLKQLQMEEKGVQEKIEALKKKE